MFDHREECTLYLRFSWVLLQFYFKSKTKGAFASILIVLIEFRCSFSQLILLKLKIITDLDVVIFGCFDTEF